MLEVEAKVRITKGEYEALFKRLSGKSKYLGESLAEDVYYEELKKGVIRMRKRGGECSFDLKLLTTVKGIESNLEMEWKLKDPVGWKRLLKKIGLLPFMRKAKRTKVFELKGFRIELSNVQLLGYFLEIEKLVGSESDIAKTKKALIKCFQELGYHEENFEPKRYLELLREK